MDENTANPPNNFIGLAADVVAAYVANNNVPAAELPILLNGVHSALAGLGQGASGTVCSTA
jgi:predicted transcriptional regulator